MAFIRRKENFKCAYCAKMVKGNGYTNHCPFCLWSKHVDIEPGDRLEKCQGMMAPMRLEKKSDQFVIVHKCQKCGLEKSNRSGLTDNLDLLLS